MKTSVSRKVLGLLRVYDTLMQELRETGVIRSNNNPVADFAEHLACETFEWELTPKSTKGHDATDHKGIRYEIKARRLTDENGSRQLSAIRNIDGRNFDFLLGILFKSDFSVHRAALIPWQVVVDRARFTESTNSSKLILSDVIWDEPDVSDVSQRLQSLLS